MAKVRNRIPIGLGLAAAFCFAACGGAEHEVGLSGAASGTRSQASKAAGTGKVTVCHIPPGNPDNRHDITVGAPAVSAHLAHGDFVGSCSCSKAGGACTVAEDCCQDGPFPLFCNFPTGNLGVCGGGG